MINVVKSDESCCVSEGYKKSEPRNGFGVRLLMHFFRDERSRQLILILTSFQDPRQWDRVGAIGASEDRRW